MSKVAFIGIGNMGAPMVRNLLAKGHAVRILARSPETTQLLCSAGAEAAQGMRELLSDVEVVVSIVPGDRQVREIYLGPNGIIGAAPRGTLLIDSSTIDVSLARELAQLAQAAGHDMIDAPVSGGVGGATAGTLTFMVGGNLAAFERATPLLKDMGRSIVHAGGPGSGQAVKLCNNMICAVSMIAVGEAFVMGEWLGLEPQTIFDVVAASSGQCWSLTRYCPVPGPVPTSPANHGYKAGFAASLMLKDLRLMQSAAQGAGAPVPLASLATSLYTVLENMGLGGQDFSAIVKLLRGERQ